MNIIEKQSHKKLQKNTNDYIRTFGAKQKLQYLQHRVDYFRKRMLELCDSMEQDTKLEYTGWFVLLKKKGKKWECLGIYNPDIATEEEEKALEKPEMEWDICLPIPAPETIKEFEGW